MKDTASMHTMLIVDRSKRYVVWRLEFHVCRAARACQAPRGSCLGAPCRLVRSAGVRVVSPGRVAAGGRCGRRAGSVPGDLPQAWPVPPRTAWRFVSGLAQDHHEEQTDGFLRSEK